MGCFSSKDSQSSEETVQEVAEEKVYSWDKRRETETDKEKYFVRNKFGIENSVFRNDVCDLPITIDNCSDCLIILLGVAKTVTIDECKNIKVICFSADSLYIRNSTNVTVMAVCGQYRCRDCRILKLYLHSGTQPVIESSQKVSVAPFYVDFDGIERYLKDLAISKFANYWDKIHDFGPFGSEPNWIVDKSLLSDLESIYLSFSSRFVSAPILRTENSFFPIIRENQNDGGELSFAIFCGDNAEGLATSCYTQFVVQSKIGVLVQSSAGKLSSLLLPERAKKQLSYQNGYLIGLLFKGHISAIDYSKFADPGQSYVSFQQEAKVDSELFFNSANKQFQS